jgi:hypothetical protein
MTLTSPVVPRSYLLFWLAIPMLLIWLAASYLLGVARQPAWQDRNTQNQNQVLAAQTDAMQPKIAATRPPFIWQGTGLVSFWFDDGWLTQYTVAAPLLQAKGYPAALAISSGLVGYDAYMSWGQVKRLYHSYGWEISAHSRTHNCDAGTLTGENLKSEIQGSYQDLINQGLEVESYVLPCGVKTPELISQVKQTYTALRDSEGSLNPLPVADPYILHAYTIHDNVSVNQIETWLAQAAKEKTWLILMFHQVDTGGGDYSLKPDTMAMIINLVNQSGLPVVLPSDALQIRAKTL